MESILVKIAKDALFTLKSLFGPKSAFWAQNALLAQKVIFRRKCDLEQKVPFGTLTNSHTLSPNRIRGRPDPKKWIFAPKITFWLQNAFWAQKCIFGAEAHFLRKNALFRPHGADAYKTNGILIKMEPFSPQKRFWTQKCTLGSKINFWLKMHFGRKSAFLAPKCTLCVNMHFCVPMPRMLIKPMEF